MEHGEDATAPSAPLRTGYMFLGWDIEFTNVKEALVVTATYVANWYDLVYYDEDEETVLQSTLHLYGDDLTEHVPPDPPEKEGKVFWNWTGPVLPETMPDRHIHLIANYIIPEETYTFNLVPVGVSGTTYTMPIGFCDTETTDIPGGYSISTTTVTYDVWYYVRLWAEGEGYGFLNPGQEGSEGTAGALPTDEGTQPVTGVSWRDVIVWLNAYSTFHGLDPVYRTPGGDILMDSSSFATDSAVQTTNNGYRLPTSDEWEMAARWRNDTESTHGSIHVGDRWWTPGNYASGAIADTDHTYETALVAWYWVNAAGLTRPVAQLGPNPLGLYDMSGNVWEWTYSLCPNSWRIFRGGCVEAEAEYMQIGGWSSMFSAFTHYTIGFRVVKDSE